MFRTAYRIGRTVHAWCEVLPANRLITRLRGRREVAPVLAASAVLVPTYVAVSLLASAAITGGGPGWLHLIVLCCCWNALKFAMLGVWILAARAGLAMGKS